MHITYEGAVDIDSISDDLIREGILAQVGFLFCFASNKSVILKLCFFSLLRLITLDKPLINSLLSLIQLDE